MARLLIADDELYTLDGILQCIDFTRLGISEVQTAADGLAAIRLLDTYQPDILAHRRSDAPCGWHCPLQAYSRESAILPDRFYERVL